MEAPSSTLLNINVFSAMLQTLNVFSATIKVMQILPQARMLLKINQIMETLQELDFFNSQVGFKVADNQYVQR